MTKRIAIKTGKYKSRLEARIAKELKKGFADVKYEGTLLPYTIRKDYVPDFIVTTRTGKTIYIETKGYFTAEDRQKMRAVRDSHPSLDIRLMFDKNNKISKKGKMKYMDWALAWGFTAAVKSIPKEWFSE